MNQKNMNIALTIASMLALLILAAACTRQLPAQNSQDGQPIGGQRDEHGCLGPAGYSWNENIGACARSWEIDDENKERAAKLAVELVGQQSGLTIAGIQSLKCPGCFDIVLDINSEQRIDVAVRDWQASLAEEKSISSFAECVAAGYPVMESYPRQCSADGQTFTEEVDITCENRCGDGVCDEIVCQAVGCPCAETAETCPEDCG